MLLRNFQAFATRVGFPFGSVARSASVPTSVTKVYDEQKSVHARTLEVRERLRTFLRNAKDRQVSMRNAAAEALGRLVEARTDGYPDLAQVGQLAAAADVAARRIVLLMPRSIKPWSSAASKASKRALISARRSVPQSSRSPVTSVS